MVPPEGFRVGVRLNQELPLQIALMMGRLISDVFGNDIAVCSWSKLQVCLCVARGLVQNQRQNKMND